MSVSVIIPTKNEERWLPRVLASLKTQTRPPDEVVVADAGSSDRTREIAEAAGARVVEGGMPGVGRNRGAAAADGELLVFLDADVVLDEPRFLERTVAEMNERRLDVATVDMEPDRARRIDHLLYRGYNWYARITERFLPHAAGTCIFVRRAVHLAHGGFDEGVIFAEDMEYVRRLKRAGCRFGILRAHPIQVSMRRLDKEGRPKLLLKLIYGEWHLLVRGAFRGSLPFEYKMGEYEEEITADRR